MKSISSKIVAGLKKMFSEDVQVYSGGWPAILYAVSSTMAVVYYNNRELIDFSTSHPWVLLSKQAYGIHILTTVIAIIIGMTALWQLTSKKKKEPLRIILVTCSVLLIAISGLMILH